MAFKGDFRFLAVISLIPALAVISFVDTPQKQPNFEMLIPSSPQVTQQIEYAKKHYYEPNLEEYGYLGSVDCANFVSQTLIARGWKMDETWWQDPEAYEGYGYSRAWVSSTAFNSYLMANPHLAQPLSWGQRDVVAVGDIVMFDWDGSGDRDHTAIVSGVRVGHNGREILITAHSEGMFDYPLSQELLNNPDTTKVYFWRVLDNGGGPSSLDAKPLEPHTPEALQTITETTQPQ